MSTQTLAIDSRMIHASGIGTYLQGLLSGIRNQPPSDYALALLGDPAALPTGPWSTLSADSEIYSLREQWEIPRAASRAKAALLHSPHYNLPCAIASKTVVTVHDLTHLKFPGYWPSPLARAYSNFFFYHVVPKAKAILTVSQNSKRDMMTLLSIPEDKITVTYPAVAHRLYQEANPAASAAFQALHLPTDYFLFVGNLKAFKNVERLVEIYARLRHEKLDLPALVVVGRNSIPGFEDVLKRTHGVHALGEVSRDILPCIYKAAQALIFPSLYEGFGLPPLEAMAAGTPVICSNRASLPEVVGQAALLIDPESPEQLASAMMRMATEPSLRKDLTIRGLKQAASFSWDTMARQTLEVYAKCLR